MISNDIVMTQDFMAWADLERAILDDDGLAAKQHLMAGRAIYYGDPEYPDGLIKKFPDGRKQLVSVNAAGEISVIRDL